MYVLKPIGTFECAGSDGRAYTVHAAQEFSLRRAGARRTLTPADPFVFLQGRALARLDKGRYRTADGVELVTDAPAAP